jgi:hypothetical protein
MTADEATSRIAVVVAETHRDLLSDVIVTAVQARPDMVLVKPPRRFFDEKRYVATIAQAEELLRSMPPTTRCAVAVVGPTSEAQDHAARWVRSHAALVVVHVAVGDSVIRVTLPDTTADALIDALRDLVARLGDRVEDRVASIELDSTGVRVQSGTPPSSHRVPPGRPLLPTAIEWLRQLLLDAVVRAPNPPSDGPLLAMTQAPIVRTLECPFDDDSLGAPLRLQEIDGALDDALAAAASTEPLACVARNLELDRLEFRMLLLSLAPELDHRFQPAIGFLLDDAGRRVGTTALYGGLLGGAARVRRELARSGRLVRWSVFESTGGHPVPADEPLRIDPFVARWILGEAGALAADPQVDRVLRVMPWPGAALLGDERARAERLIAELRERSEPRWVVLAGDDPSGWRGLLELGATATSSDPIRIETACLSGMPLADVEDCGHRVARLARLTASMLFVDVNAKDGSDADDAGLRCFFATLVGAGCCAAVVCLDAAHVVRLLEGARHTMHVEPPLPVGARGKALRTAAKGADAYLSEGEAAAMARQYPLAVDGFERAMRVASNLPLDLDADNPRLARFTAGVRYVAGENVSPLAQRIEPAFGLADVVLPPERMQQLVEIVDNVRFAPRVLDEWNFGGGLPYGRGVTALFFGPSGTGKTMAAMGIARELGVSLARLDLSKVPSKYIGDTEKNIDRVFSDAQASGAAILIDEADALMGKRSEVRDAHDRYANLEVAYLLQRMEAYEGLAILTTNLRQNLDSAFLRRLRFVVEFPRPDVPARETIWRQCVPDRSHALDAAAFRQLARRIDLTGGHIRQITVRAAFLAAASGSLIRLEHVVQAARAELAKLGLPPVDPALLERRKAA